MLQKLSLVVPCDSTGVFLASMFHVYQKNVASVATFTKVSVSLTKPRCRISKKKKLSSFMVSTVYPVTLKDTSVFFTKTNSAVLLKKSLSMSGSVTFGPASYLVKRKKFLKSFARIL